LTQIDDTLKLLTARAIYWKLTNIFGRNCLPRFPGLELRKNGKRAFDTDDRKVEAKRPGIHASQLGLVYEMKDQVPPDSVFRRGESRKNHCFPSKQKIIIFVG
jgi:hypothetical protein